MSDPIMHLRGVVEPYQFGKLDLLDRMEEIDVRVSPDMVEIGNWYDYRPENVHGDCGELMAKAYRKIRETFPHLAIEACWGYDTQLFTQFVGRHAFLVVRENQEGPGILVDPALKRIEPFDESGYLIEEIESPFFVEGKLASERAPLFLNGEEVSLLGIDERTGLICYIGMNCGNGTDDMLSLTTLKHFPPEYSEFFPPEKRTFPISPCPEEILKQVPYFALAHQLEIIAAAHR
ncbi:hypothetical protein J4460_00175 [Candidatus Woesearchaeota archaeon]|nr:MAG: hypothetical protein QS99_C0002G0152 [archaeon GW2011_AR4]MBS3129066.1 hypothetical protein [Candidatus Woesearchaeota archaeon]HIH37800.1 hypothetical protein [Candidatus Woesearchaeota archaeon]HIH48426.1 hypothetical protein [Candidatus Woesearchaeota archaeon]HIJ03925.1 hypothetical protein [Candidatus Woesearchaeota archaeon]